MMREIKMAMTKPWKATFSQTFAGMGTALEIAATYTLGEYRDLSKVSPSSDAPELSFTSICKTNYSNLWGACALY